MHYNLGSANAREHANIPDLVKRFRNHLSSSRHGRPLKLISINALCQLVQKDAIAMSKLGGDRLVEDLFVGPRCAQRYL
jgi:hypothetical protein